MLSAAAPRGPRQHPRRVEKMKRNQQENQNNHRKLKISRQTSHDEGGLLLESSVGHLY